MSIVAFDHVDKIYSISHVKYRALSNDFNLAFQNAWRFLTGSASQNEQFYALRDVSFNIKEGEAVGLIGPNGAGKSTLLRLVANVTKPTRGSVQVNGRVAPLLEVGAGFHPELSGRENVFLNGAILGMSKTAIARKFDEIVSFAELENFIDAPIKQYSSGMYVRLGFSVAVHSDFDTLLADEIFAVGDQRFREKCLARINQMKQQGKTIVIISHATELLKNYCSRGICIKKGSVVFDGAIEGALQAYSKALI